MPRTQYPAPKSKSPGLVLISGRFKTTNGTDPTEIEGIGFTPVWTAEGKWTVTLDATYRALNSITGSAMLAAAAANGGDLTVHFDPIEEDTACSSFVVYLSQDGNDADTPGAWVNFQALLRETLIKR